VGVEGNVRRIVHTVLIVAFGSFIWGLFAVAAWWFVGRVIEGLISAWGGLLG
jgi:hypothetical protein